MRPVIEWSDTKNDLLVRRYGFGFERVVDALGSDGLLDVRAHPNPERYAHQKQLIVLIDAYVWVVPFVENDGIVFLETMFPSRKASKQFFGEAS